MNNWLGVSCEEIQHILYLQLAELNATLTGIKYSGFMMSPFTVINVPYYLKWVSK